MKFNKIILMSLFTVISVAIKAQVGIETIAVRGSALIDFPQNQNRGIILPKAIAPTGTAGSLLLDVTSGMVKISNGTSWQSLNTNAATSLPALDNTGFTENHAPTVIGATSSTANGVMILESTDKALVLPWVANPHLNIVKPEPGTICYDTTSQSIAVFNGLEWSYWK